MAWIRVGGIIAVVASLIFIFRPQALIALNNWGKKHVFDDELLFKYHVRTGILSLIIGLLLIYVGFIR